MCVVPKTNLLEFDEGLPNRDELLNAELMQKRFTELLGLEITNCEIVRAKYHINSSLRVVYKGLINREEQLISTRVYTANPENIEIHLFPNDRKLKNLSVLERKFDSRIVAYAPEKCATAACFDKDGQVFGFAKIYAEKEWQTGERVCQFLTEQTQKGFPKLFAFDEENRILMLEAVKGQRLSELDKAKLTKGFRLLGKAIGKLHEVKTKVNLPEFSRLSPDRIKKAVKTISAARPDCKNQAEKLSENLLKAYSFADEEKVVLHGDIHPKNGILQDDETLMLIDFDQLAQGSAAAEIGSFLAGLHYKKTIGLNTEKERRHFSEAFLQGYVEIRNLPSRGSLNWHTASALLTERASRSISRIRIEGLQNFSRILTLSERALAGGFL